MKKIKEIAAIWKNSKLKIKDLPKTKRAFNDSLSNLIGATVYVYTLRDPHAGRSCKFSEKLCDARKTSPLRFLSMLKSEINHCVLQCKTYIKMAEEALRDTALLDKEDITKIADNMETMKNLIAAFEIHIRNIEITKWTIKNTKEKGGHLDSFCISAKCIGCMDSLKDEFRYYGKSLFNMRTIFKKIEERKKAALSRKEDTSDSDARSSLKYAEGIIDATLKEALDALDDMDFEQVQFSLLSLKGTLRENTDLFKDETPSKDIAQAKNESEPMQYAVITTYSFDPEVRVVTAPNLAQAQQFMLRDFNNEKRIDVEENGFEISDKTWFSTMAASLATVYPSDIGYTQWNIVKITPLYNPEEK